MKKIFLLIFAMLAFFFTNCERENKHMVDYDFDVTFQDPEWTDIGDIYPFVMVIKNVDKNNVNNLKMKVSFSPNLTFERDGQMLETNHVYEVTFDEQENTKFSVQQKVIQNDTIYFEFSNEHFSKKADYIISQKNYKGEIKVNQTNGGIAEGEKIYSYGDTVKLLAEPNTGYLFKGWFTKELIDDEEVLKLLSNKNPYTFVFEKSFEVQPIFEISKVVLSVTAGNGGTVTGGGVYDYGKDVIIKAVADGNHNFDGWFEGEKPLSNDTELILRADRNMEITAKFKPKSYEVKINYTTGGTVTGAGVYEYGKTVTLTATPNNTYRFVGWYDAGELISNAQILNYKVLKPVVLDAKFELLIFTPKFTINIPDAGTISGQQPKYEYGDVLDVKVTDKNSFGYSFKEWQKSGDFFSKDRHLHFNIKEHGDYLAVYEKNLFDVKRFIYLPEEDLSVYCPEKMAYSDKGTVTVIIRNARKYIDKQICLQVNNGKEWEIRYLENNGTGDINFVCLGTVEVYVGLL